MKKRFNFLLGFLLLLGLAACLTLFLSQQSKKLCDQIREIRNGHEGTSVSPIFPLNFYEYFFCQMARDQDNPRAKYALKILSGMRSVRGRPIIEGYLTSKNSLFRAVAADCIASYSDEKACNSLTELLRDEKDLRVSNIAGSRLVELIYIVDIGQLDALLVSVESAEQKCIVAGLIFSKTGKHDDYKKFQEYKNHLPVESLPLIKYFEKGMKVP